MAACYQRLPTDTGGHCGHLKLALGIKKYKLITGDSNLSKSEKVIISKPILTSTEFKKEDDTNTTKNKTKATRSSGESASSKKPSMPSESK